MDTAYINIQPNHGFHQYKPVSISPAAVTRVMHSLSIRYGKEESLLLYPWEKIYSLFCFKNTACQ